MTREHLIDVIADVFGRPMRRPWRNDGVQLLAFTAEIPYTVDDRNVRWLPGSFARALERQSALDLPRPSVAAAHGWTDPGPNRPDLPTVEYGVITDWTDGPRAIRLHGVSCIPVHMGGHVSPNVIFSGHRRKGDRDEVPDAGLMIELSVMPGGAAIPGSRIVRVGDHEEAMGLLCAAA